MQQDTAQAFVCDPKCGRLSILHFKIMRSIVQAVFGIGLDFYRIVAAFLQVNRKCAVGAGGVGAHQGVVQSADLKRTVADAFSAVLIFLDKLKAA